MRIETLVSPVAADQIIAHLVERYFPDYAIIAYMQDVAVVRKEKYT
ncbi:MAG: P-II family nitrogen regulator [Chloroflexaceae bacterium]